MASLLVNIKGIGQVDVPEGTTKEQIQDILTKSFTKKKEEKTFSLREVELMVKGFIKEQVKPADPIVPDVKIENLLEPNFEVTAPIDVTPIAKAIAKLELPTPAVNVNMEKLDIPAPEVNFTMPDTKGQVIRIKVESRTRSGAIDTLLLTQIN